MSLEIEVQKTALVLIDLQKGIVSMPLAPHSSAQIIERSVTLGSALKIAGGTLVLVHVGFAQTEVDKLKPPVDANLPSQTNAPDWSELMPELQTLAPDIVILKRQWGAFHGTELDLQLRRRDIKTIILGGIATNFGVEQTAREAWQHGYEVIIAEDLCASRDAELHQFPIKNIFPRISRVRSTKDILSSLS